MHLFTSRLVAKIRTARNQAPSVMLCCLRGWHGQQKKWQRRNVCAHSDFEPDSVSKPWFRKSLLPLPFTLSLEVNVLPILNRKLNCNFWSGLIYEYNFSIKKSDLTKEPSALENIWTTGINSQLPHISTQSATRYGYVTNSTFLPALQDKILCGTSEAPLQ